MGFKKGIEAVNEVAQRSGFTGGKNRFFNWKSGDTKVIRFLTEADQIVLTNVHEFVTGFNGKKNSFVCRREVNADCELCENGQKRRELALAAAIWREETKVDGKSVYKTKTEEVEVEEDGKTVTKVVPWVGIIRQAPKNFWGWFYDANDKFGTLMDRDYSVSRRGVKLDTTYAMFAEDKQEIKGFPEKFAEFLPDLEEFLTWQSSEAYYDRYLRGIEPKKDEEAADSTDSELTKEDLAELEKANKELASTASSGEYD